jgi:hypothetical protein
LADQLTNVSMILLVLATLSVFAGVMLYAYRSCPCLFAL